MSGKNIFFLFFIIISAPFLSSITVNVGPTRTYTTIQNAIDAYPPSTILDIFVDPGIYTENIDSSTKRISITGSGNGNDPLVDTIIKKGSDNPIIKINTGGTSTENVIFSNFRIVPEGVYAFEFPNQKSISYIHFSDLAITGDPAAWGEREIGIKVSTTADVDYIVISDTSFSYLDYGLYFAKHGDWNPSTSNVTNFLMENCSLSDNDYKGAYIEKLSDAVFDNVTINENGHTPFWNDRWNAGIDINLKGDNYQNISFNNCTFQDNANGFQDSAALMIKARDDGATYGTYPATLSNVLITNCEFINNERGLRFGEPGKNNAGPSNVVIRESTINGNVQTYSGNDGTEYGGIINYSLVQTDARYNYWDAQCTGPFHLISNPTGQGDTVYGDVIFTPWRCSSSPVAIIRTTPASPEGISPFTIIFDGTKSYDSTNTIISYRWDLGEGTTVTGSVVTHVYQKKGKFNVTLTITNSIGIEDTASIIVNVVDKNSISAVLWTDAPMIKARGRETTLINAELYSDGKKLNNQYRINFAPLLGTTEGPVNFEKISSRYSQILRSGIPGTDTIKLYLGNDFITETSINYIWIQPPSSFEIDVFDDSKIFVKHYVSVLKWSAPALNYDKIILKGFRIYRSFDGISWEIISEPSSSTYELSDSISVLPVKYRIVSLDIENNESSGLEVKWE